ncbi:hypothetical protein EU537_06850 [Candidatus Thorarchaeota archaeon]|nr:MAG: hypothetical protein EU537_06850 [Candidatus Thorarchaeota archaeon]
MDKTEMTQAKVLKVVEGNEISLPSDFVKGMSQPFGLAILVVKDRNVKIYPVGSNKVLYLRLEIEKLSKSFLEELTSIFERADLEDILFTSGICQEASKCFYECYFTPEQLSVEVDDLRDQISGITGVKKVKLVNVPLE